MDTEAMGIIAALALSGIALSGKVVDLMSGLITGKKGKAQSNPPSPRPASDNNSMTTGVLRFQCEDQMGRVTKRLEELKQALKDERAELICEQKAQSKRLGSIEITLARIEGRQEAAAEKELKR